MQLCVRPGVSKELVELSSVELAVNISTVGVMSTRPLIILYIKLALLTVRLSRRVCNCGLFTSSVALSWYILLVARRWSASIAFVRCCWWDPTRQRHTPTYGGPDLCSKVSEHVGASFKISVYKSACSVCLGSGSLDVFSPMKVGGQFYT